MVKGFKGFNEDLTCRGFRYEIGKTYKHNGEVELCSSGFHFCRKLKDVHNFYNLKTSRICEIEADGKIDDDGIKSVCSRMRIVREVSREEYTHAYDYAYLIEPPAEPKYKPFESVDKAMDAIKKHGGWLERKSDGLQGIVVAKSSDRIKAVQCWYRLGDMFQSLVFADDGSPCGELVEE